jgi:hypothetical protein
VTIDKSIPIRIEYRYRESSTYIPATHSTLSYVVAIIRIIVSTCTFHFFFFKAMCQSSDFWSSRGHWNRHVGAAMRCHRYNTTFYYPFQIRIDLTITPLRWRRYLEGTCPQCIGIVAPRMVLVPLASWICENVHSSPGVSSRGSAAVQSNKLEPSFPWFLGLDLGLPPAPAHSLPQVSVLPLPAKDRLRLLGPTTTCIWPTWWFAGCVRIIVARKEFLYNLLWRNFKSYTTSVLV